MKERSVLKQQLSFQQSTVKDINGGYWGLVIILSAFMIQVISSGVSFSIGIYNIEFLEYYPNDAVAVSLEGAINLGCFLGSGYLRKLSRGYTSSMYAAGALAIFGGLLMVLIPLKNKIVRNSMKIQETEIDIALTETDKSSDDTKFPSLSVSV